MGGKGEVKGQRTMEKAGDLQRGQQERQRTKEVREPGGQCRGVRGGDGWGWTQVCGDGQGLSTQRCGACSSFVWLGEAFGGLVGVQEEQKTPES